MKPVASNIVSERTQWSTWQPWRRNFTSKQCGPSFFEERTALILVLLYLITLTIDLQTVLLGRKNLPSQEVIMSEEKLRILRQSHTLHPHPDQVRDPLFTAGSAFFDPRDLVQVKYELLRRVRVDGESVSHAASLFALSRPTFYAAQAAWERAGLVGLFPEPTGPRHAHKLTEPILALLRPRTATMSSTQLAAWLREAHQLIVHPRSIERALARAGKKGGSQ
jgi:transposase